LGQCTGLRNAKSGEGQDANKYSAQRRQQVGFQATSDSSDSSQRYGEHEVAQQCDHDNEADTLV